MKRHILAAAVLLSVAAAFATEPAKNDTTALAATDVHEIIADTTVNSKGKTVVKYYLKVGNELVSTSKSVVEKMKLCRRYNADCPLGLVTNLKSHRKRVILN